MPHECTTCGHTFPDGSKEMLSGCPECGGNKFRFMPAGSGASGESQAEEALSTADAGTTSHETIGDDIIVAEETELEFDREDRAQASARSAIVSEDEIPEADDVSSLADTDADGDDEEAPTPETDGERDRPDLSELREELNDQFESIKILQPGEYELNLMELYDREERIVALEEDGRYVIDVPSSWHEDESE